MPWQSWRQVGFLSIPIALLLNYLIYPVFANSSERHIYSQEQPLDITRLRSEAEQLLQKGRQLYGDGQYQSVLEVLRNALLIYQALGDRAQEAAVLNLIGLSCHNLGEYERALTLYQQALAVAQSVRSRSIEADVLNNLGLTHSSIGQLEQALSFYEQAFVAYRESSDRWGEGASLLNIGFAHETLGHYTQAITYSEQSLNIWREIGDRVSEAHALTNIGMNYYYLSQLDSALRSLKQASIILDELNNASAEIPGRRLAEGYTFSTLGKVYADLGRTNGAWNVYQSSLTIFTELGERSGKLTVLSRMGDLLAQKNQPELAIVFYKQSVNVTESIRRDIQGLPVEQQQSYTNTIADTYRKLADLLLQQDRVLEAQQVLDLLKVQEIQDYLRRGVRGTEQTAEGIYLLEAEKQVFTRFDQLLQQGRRLSELEAIPPETLTPEQQTELGQLSQTRSQIKASFNGFLDLPDVQTALQQLRTTAPQALNLDTLDAIRQNINQSRPDAVLLYPFVLEDRLELVVLSPHLPPIHKTVPVTRVELNQAIVEFLTVLQDPNSDAKPAAQKLYNWLVRPIKPFLTQSGAKVILYAPDQRLRYIPLSALHDGEQWLVETFQINQLTAASLTSLDTPPRPQPRILAGAFSTGRYNISRRNGEYRYPFNGLPYAKTEVQKIASLFPDTRQLIDLDFTEAATLPFLNSYNIVHFATHAMFVTGAPDDSFILLGNGDTIDLNELRNLSLTNVDLMVLSGCQTAVSTLNLGQELGDGVEILGFGYQVQNAGVRAAIASLWSVDDGGTEVLMSRFYALLQQDNLAKAAALQQAQIALIQGDAQLLPQSAANSDPPIAAQQLTHPYYWAPFILIGNGL